jgi:hypothetical protein
MQPLVRDELAQRRAPLGKRSKELTQSLGVDLQFGDAGSFARNTKEFDVHHVSGRNDRRNLMITWAFNPSGGSSGRAGQAEEPLQTSSQRHE